MMSLIGGGGGGGAYSPALMWGLADGRYHDL